MSMPVQAQQYAALRKPYLINDINECSTLMDRRSVYKRLQARASLTNDGQAMPSVRSAVDACGSEQTWCRGTGQARRSWEQRQVPLIE